MTMFPIHLKLTISTPAELARVTAFIGGDYAATVVASPKLGVSADEKRDLVSSTACDDQHAPDPTTAPGKPNPNDAATRGPRTTAATADKPAPGQRTAEVAAATAAPAKTVAEPTRTAASAAVEQPASTAVTYPDLQKAVLTLHKLDATAAVPIAKSLGADTFKLLKPEQWADALTAVNSKIAEIQGA